MNEISLLTEKIISFLKERDWEQFHKPKDTALALFIESAELNELFLWKGDSDVNVAKLEEELADVIIYSLDLAHQFNLDVSKIVNNKIALNVQKYPVAKCKGSAKKYTEL